MDQKKKFLLYRCSDQHLINYTNMPTFSKENADILIFKTNLRFKKDLKKISAHIKVENRIKMWNVDIADKDKVLRIESVDIQANEIIEIVEHAGYQCEELTD